MDGRRKQTKKIRILSLRTNEYYGILGTLSQRKGYSDVGRRLRSQTKYKRGIQHRVCGVEG